MQKFGVLFVITLLFVHSLCQADPTLYNQNVQNQGQNDYAQNFNNDLQNWQNHWQNFINDWHNYWRDYWSNHWFKYWQNNPQLLAGQCQNLGFQQQGYQYPQNQQQTNQYPPNQYQMNQYPQNQYQTNQYPHNQYPPNQYPPNQYEPNQYQPNQPSGNLQPPNQAQGIYQPALNDQNRKLTIGFESRLGDSGRETDQGEKELLANIDNTRQEQRRIIEIAEKIQRDNNPPQGVNRSRIANIDQTVNGKALTIKNTVYSTGTEMEGAIHTVQLIYEGNELSDWSINSVLWVGDQRTKKMVDKTGSSITKDRYGPFVNVNCQAV